MQGADPLSHPLSLPHFLPRSLLWESYDHFYFMCVSESGELSDRERNKDHLFFQLEERRTHGERVVPLKREPLQVLCKIPQ